MKINNKIEITAIKSLWTLSPTHGTKDDKDQRMINIRDKVLERDKNTCQYCGWHSKKHMEIHHIDHNHENYDLDNLITCCPLCHQCFHLPSIETLKGGKMIWLPEIPQEVLNNLCINLFLHMNMSDKAETSTSIYNALMERATFLPQLSRTLGDASSASMYAEIMVDLDPENPEHKNILDNIRNNIKILPSKNRFKTQIDAWAKEYNIYDYENSYYKSFEKEKFNKIYNIYKDKFEKENKEEFL